MFRRRASGIEVFLAHPGGPFFARKDSRSWTIPKGEIQSGADPLEETFPEIDRADFFSLETARIKMNPAQAALLDTLQQILTEHS